MCRALLGTLVLASFLKEAAPLAQNRNSPTREQGPWLYTFFFRYPRFVAILRTAGGGFWRDRVGQGLKSRVQAGVLH